MLIFKDTNKEKKYDACQYWNDAVLLICDLWEVRAKWKNGFKRYFVIDYIVILHTCCNLRMLIRLQTRSKQNQTFYNFTFFGRRSFVSTLKFQSCDWRVIDESTELGLCFMKLYRDQHTLYDQHLWNSHNALKLSFGLRSDNSKSSL